MADNKNDEELIKAFECLDKLTAPVKQHLSPAKDIKIEYCAPEIYKPDFSEMLPKIPDILPNFGKGESPIEIIEGMKKELEKSNQAISDVKAELQKERDSHRHDTLKQIFVGIAVALISSVISILVTHVGLF